MKIAPHYLKRYKDIAMLLLKYGNTSMVSKFGLDDALEDEERVEAAQPASEEELPNDLEAMGPTFVKLGQLLAGRPDLLPERHLKALSRLQDKVKPFSYAEVEEIVESELGVRISKAFTRFDSEPIAAASLGQVHRAELRDGRPVVVKVQRPHIRKQISEDFAALQEIANFFERHTKLGRRYQMVRVLEEFQKTLTNELDYEREASNLKTLGQNLKRFQRIQVPQPIADYTTHRVLTMERIEGKKITELSPLIHLDIDGCVLAEELFKAYLQQVLVDGLFHADPHPGNVFLTNDFRIALLDLGMVGHIAPRLQDKLLKLLIAVSEGHSEEAADIAIEIGETSEEFNEVDFRRRISQLVADQLDNTLKQIDVGQTILELGRNAGENGLFVPTELSVLGKTLLQLDQVGRILDPAFDPNESIRRNAGKLMNQRMKKTFSEGKILSSALEMREFVGALPARLNKFMDTVAGAEFNLKVKVPESHLYLEGFQKVANRITTGLILAALIVGAALLMQVPTTFRIFGYPGLAILCFLSAGGGGLWLVCSIVWQDHKSKEKARKERRLQQ
ncbi:ABC1 kinase family protein [Pedosphaera parvula]|uniref:ABC-1 domain protein n=1 Tax=Pedosphaera parvula (strain Ellin514) TaxID=320771 RepID=B9X9Q8_PEDPL|nr:AarF/UbiB family protein [Pedosphaera parvula]EEF63206.1 ABC-1 domain protein [Pedosphaera parvula Ellin514]